MRTRRRTERQQLTQRIHDADEKEKFEVVDSDVITYGWLVPGGYGVNCGWMDHLLVPRLLGLGMSDVFKLGWVRKAGLHDYELYRHKREAIEELSAHLIHLQQTGHIIYGFRNNFHVDAIDELLPLRKIRSYRFAYDDFVLEGMKVSKIIRGKRYEML